MYDLPMRAAELDAPTTAGPTFRMATLTTEQRAEIMDHLSRKASRNGDGQGALELTFPASTLLRIFADRVVGVVGDELTVAGEPFEASRPEHVGSTPSAWQIEAVTALVSYELRLPAAVEKASAAPA